MFKGIMQIKGRGLSFLTAWPVQVFSLLSHHMSGFAMIFPPTPKFF